MRIIISLFFITFFLISCTKNVEKKSLITEDELELQVSEAYNEGVKSLEAGDVLFAAKKFNEVELLFPQSEWAAKSALMAAYSYYSQDYYVDAIAETQRFIKVYPLHKNVDYAHYILSLSYYEQIVDETKDLQSITLAKKNFEILINKFPNSPYVLDSKFKIDLINDVLAAKEMYVGRYYFEKKKWIPAINRFREVVDNYDTTIYVEEALHRLVEVYYTIGLKNEAKKYAQLLGYNYKSSEWYEKSYKLFNKSYENNKLKVQKKKSLLSRLKSLAD